MTPDQALDALADHHGILPSFRDLSGREVDTSSDTKAALLRANGIELDNPAMIKELWAETHALAADRLLPTEVIVEAGKPGPILPCANWQLEIEGQSRVEGRGPLPTLPPGVHSLALENSGHQEEVTLIAAPRAAPTIEDLTGQSRLWGVTGALYAMRSSRNLGLGDFEDLAGAASAAAARGAGFFGINPIHALGWSDAETISPYSPSHRGFLNGLHIAADRIPGLETSARAKSLVATQSGCEKPDLIDYAEFRTRFHPLLEDLHAIFLTEANLAARADFADFTKTQGGALHDFTLFEALSEDHGPDWRRWPDGLRSLNHPCVASARRVCADRMLFHAWLQWVAATQLSEAQTRAREAGMPLGLYLDLAVGPRHGGAETWCESESVAQGVSVGAPPDHLSPGGQNWNLAAYAPAKLSASRYRAFRCVLRRSMNAAGLLRIDHVLGLNRSYWIPDDGSPGGYIRQPFQSLLAIVAIEANRARTAVIGEDLGLVPEEFRAATGARGLYSYSVLQYEKGKDGEFRSPEGLRPQSLACFGTHDTPTFNGYRVGRDIDWWQDLGWIDAKQAIAARRARKGEVAALAALAGKDAPADPLMQAHAVLARSPVAMVSAQLDDLAGQTEGQNLPGTVDEHPNWRRRSAVPVEEFRDWTELAETGRLMSENGRGHRSAREKETAT